MKFLYHDQTSHARWDSSGRGIGPSQGPLPATHNTHKRQTSMPPGGIRTRNPSKRAAVDPRPGLLNQKGSNRRKCNKNGWNVQWVHKFSGEAWRERPLGRFVKMKVIKLACAGGDDFIPFVIVSFGESLWTKKLSFGLLRSCKFVNRLNCCHFLKKTLHCVYSWLISWTYLDSKKLLYGKGSLGRLSCRCTWFRLMNIVSSIKSHNFFLDFDHWNLLSMVIFIYHQRQQFIALNFCLWWSGSPESEEA
jgi:hypothetical protein